MKNALKKRQDIVPHISPEWEAMKYLRAVNPKFFNDPDIRDLAVMIVLELGDEMKGMSPVKVTSLIAGIQALMYNMGKAAVQSIKGGNGMARRCVDNYKNRMKKQRRIV